MSTGDLQRKYDHWFDLRDFDGDGSIEQEDMWAPCRQVLDQFGYAPESPKYRQVIETYDQFWDSLVGQLDTDDSGILSRDEFRAAMESCVRDPEALERIFRPMAEAEFAVADDDDDGILSRGEYAQWMKFCGMSEKDTALAAHGIAQNSDGNISVAEYFRAWCVFLTSEELDSPANKVFGPVM